MATPLARIRAATEELHRQIDGLPYARAIMDGSLALPLYASFLRAVDLVHGEFAQALAAAGSPELSAVAGRFVERRALISQDLAALNAEPMKIDAASLQALVLGQEMRLAALRNPAELLGHAYVLEGSQMGGLVQQATLRKRPELAEALHYLGNASRPSFQQFVARLEAALPNEAVIEAAIAGAVTHFKGFGRIMNAVDPAREQGLRLAQELNPDAGTHALPRQLQELEAALHAGERSYREAPYYPARYGEHGLAFIRSDSAWLVTLCREDEAQIRRQIDWIARVLAARGMPRILLEEHLEFLHAALVAALPAQAESYRGLLTEAERLRGERLSALPRFEALLSAFGPEQENRIPGREAARLLASAVADEKRGVPLAVSALCKWLLDPMKFSSAWIASGNELLGKAQAESAFAEVR